MKNRRNQKFIEEWLAWCEDPRILTDQPNTCGFRNYQEFIDHRHDQSVLSILAVRQRIETFRDPSQYGDHLKMPPFRKEKELPEGIKYAEHPQENSPYGTLFHLHRQRNFSLRHKVDKLLSRLNKWNASPLPRGQSFMTSEAPKITIGITTFAHRFEKYFVPLLTRIREYDKKTEVIVAINGEHQQPFDEEYRAKILRFLADQSLVFPIIFPQFRGVAKLWNTIIIHASHDYILMLNDDIMISAPDFLSTTRWHIAKNKGRTFTINKSWSHFVVSREEIDYLGYFDERLLGIGEEDGDITWRYYHEFRRKIPTFTIKGFKNFAEESVRSYRPANIQCHSDTKYSKFNRDFLLQKYRKDHCGLPGMFGDPMILVDAGPEQYPNEKFYRKRKSEL